MAIAPCQCSSRRRVGLRNSTTPTFRFPSTQAFSKVGGTSFGQSNLIQISLARGSLSYGPQGWVLFDHLPVTHANLTENEGLLWYNLVYGPVGSPSENGGSVQIPQRFGTSILRAVQTKPSGTKNSRRGLERNAGRSRRYGPVRYPGAVPCTEAGPGQPPLSITVVTPGGHRTVRYGAQAGGSTHQ